MEGNTNNAQYQQKAIATEGNTNGRQHQRKATPINTNIKQ
jgi:hypothetical protein